MKIGETLYSPRFGMMKIEDIRGKKPNREAKITILDKEYWIPEDRIN